VEKFCQHIEKLLAQHDYVVIPNLGGFVVQTQSAQILSDTITPPLATIAFNPLMHHADGLLAIEIARSEKMSYRLAMEYIDKEVEKIRFKLDLTGTIQFGKFGSFNQDKTGTLVFKPLVEMDFLPQNFQLSNVYIPTKDSRKTENHRKITITLPPTRIFKYAAAVLLILGLFFTAPKVNDVRQLGYANLGSVSFDTNKKINYLPPPTIIKKNEVIAVKTIENDSSKVQSDFYIIVASLATQKSAEKFRNKLIASQFPQALVLPPVKTYRVAIQTFHNRKKAIEYMENLRQTDVRFETAWVLCK